MPGQCARLHMTRFLFSSRSDVPFLHVCQSKNAIATYRHNSIAGASERGNPRLPLQGTAGSHRLEFMLQTFGTIRYHCNDLLAPRDWTHALQSRNCRFAISNNCHFQTLELTCPKPRNHRLPFWGTIGSQRLDLTVPNLVTIRCHCKELLVPRSWGSWFLPFEPLVTIERN